MNKLDRFFEERLSNHSSTPVATTWDRIEASLSKKNSGVAWMRWAAVLMPGAVAATLWFNKPAEDLPLANVSETTIPAAIAHPVISLAQPTTAVAPLEIERSAKVVTRKRQVATPDAAQEPEHESVALRPEAPSLEAATIEPVAVAVTVAEVIIEEPKPIVLVYTLETITRPDQEEKKSLSLERVVEFARTVKHSDPIGDFRVMKDELFALDLRKKPTKKN